MRTPFKIDLYIIIHNMGPCKNKIVTKPSSEIALEQVSVPQCRPEGSSTVQNGAVHCANKPHEALSKRNVPT